MIEVSRVNLLFAIAAAVLAGILHSGDAFSQDRDALKRQIGTLPPEVLREEIKRRAMGGYPSEGLGPRSPERDLLGSADDGTLNEAIRERVGGRPVYGPDERHDWNEFKNVPEIAELASASVALVAKNLISPSSGGNFKLAAQRYKDAENLCDGEAFENQAIVPFCSGTLIAPDLVLTAGHCAQGAHQSRRGHPLGEIAFVFGYRVENPGEPGVTEVPPAQIYYGSEVDGELIGSRDRDWAIVRLSTAVQGQVARPVTRIKREKIASTAKLFVIGYPSGLPIKYAPNAEVHENGHPIYFVANLDTFGGNSGSGVFDQQTKELVGILVRGGADYVWANAKGRDCEASAPPGRGKQCCVVNACPKTPQGGICLGEDVSRAGIAAGSRLLTAKLGLFR